MVQHEKGIVRRVWLMVMGAVMQVVRWARFLWLGLYYFFGYVLGRCDNTRVICISCKPCSLCSTGSCCKLCQGCHTLQATHTSQNCIKCNPHKCRNCFSRNHFFHRFRCSLSKNTPLMGARVEGNKIASLE